MASEGIKKKKILSPKKDPQTKIARLLIPSIKHFSYFPAKWKSLARLVIQSKQSCTVAEEYFWSSDFFLLGLHNDLSRRNCFIVNAVAMLI